MTTPTLTPVPIGGKALYRIPEAAQLLNLSRSVVYELIRAGRLRAVNEGRARRITAGAIAEYINLLERESTREGNK